MIKAKFWIVSFTVLVTGLSALAYEKDLVATACTPPRIEGGGGELPSPFSTSNQRVELAVGEYYKLVGRIVAGPTLDGVAHGSGLKRATTLDMSPYFEIDLKEHPWLANVTRRKDPTYPLFGGWDVWGKFTQKRVKLTVLAREKYLFDASLADIKFMIALKQSENSEVEVMDGSVTSPSTPNSL